MGLMDGKCALVTGASSGIGRATALRFAAEGADLVLSGRDAAALGEVASRIEGGGRRAATAVGDVTDRSVCEAAVETARTAFARLDVLVSSAGIIGSGTIETTDTAAWHEMMRINVDAVFHLVQLAVPMLKETRGAVVNVSSVTGLRAFPGVLAYCVSKAAADQLTRCAALELAPAGVRVNAVNPGVVVSNLHRRGGMDDEAYDAFLDHSKSTHPLGRVGQTGDIVEAILWLATDASSWITGETISVDGGRHLTCAR